MPHEVVTDVRCPFCKSQVVPYDTTEHGIVLYACTNPECEESEDLVGTIEMWYHLVVVAEEMTKGRKDGRKNDSGSTEKNTERP